MNKIRPTLILVTAAVTAALLVLFSACEISGGDETVREVSLRIAGAYQNSSGIPARQTGQRITLLSIMQSGDRLDAVDNAGGRWSGSIGRAEGGVATFTLKGGTSAGASVVLTGTISVSGTTASLSGTWIEPSLQSAASAQATVAAQPTPTPIPNNTPVPGATPTPGIQVTPGPTASPTP